MYYIFYVIIYFLKQISKRDQSRLDVHAQKELHTKPNISEDSFVC
jgi:hypothetical protein